jgi:anti-anti-sigma factor
MTLPAPTDLDIPFETEHYLAITVSRMPSGLAVVLHVEGHLDHDTVPLLRQRVAPFVGHGFRAIVFDLAKLQLMTSPGIGAFLNVKRSQEKLGAQCLFVGVPPRIRRVFDVMDAVPSGNVFANAREMDAYLLALQRGDMDERVDEGVDARVDERTDGPTDASADEDAGPDDGPAADR